jgi:hypothetical protein
VSVTVIVAPLHVALSDGSGSIASARPSAMSASVPTPPVDGTRNVKVRPLISTDQSSLLCQTDAMSLVSVKIAVE